MDYVSVKPLKLNLECCFQPGCVSDAPGAGRANFPEEFPCRWRQNLNAWILGELSREVLGISSDTRCLFNGESVLKQKSHSCFFFPINVCDGMVRWMVQVSQNGTGMFLCQATTRSTRHSRQT